MPRCFQKKPDKLLPAAVALVAPLGSDVLVTGDAPADKMGTGPVRAYVDEFLPDVMEGRIEPGRVFEREVGLDGVPDGYRAMNDREARKVMVRP